MDKVEQWMDIPQYEGLYQISNLGRIWSVRTQRLLKPKLAKSGYYAVILTKPNNKRQEERIHRLVALTFIPNPEHLPVVNHKNEIKTDNNVENLEWCTVQYNTQYSSYKWTGTNNGMNKPGVREKHKAACNNAHGFESKQVLDTTTGITYKSVRDAERQTGISRYLIRTTDRFKISEIGGFDAEHSSDECKF